MNLGYQVDSDDVYVFTSDGGDVPQVPETAALQPEPESTQFKPWSMSFCLLISCCSSFIITFILWLFGRGKDKEDDSQQEESGNAGDNLNLD